MSDPRVVIEFDSHSGLYQPGDKIGGSYRIETSQPESVRAVEVSVLWFTEGKGEEDLDVHYFDRIAGEEGRKLDLEKPHLFETVLPRSPLSYEGIIIKLRWCVRIRVFLRGGRDITDEQPFQLGDRPRPEIAQPESEASEAT